MTKWARLLSYILVFVLMLTTPVTAFAQTPLTQKDQKPAEILNEADQQMIQQTITQMTPEEKNWPACDAIHQRSCAV